MMQQDVTTPYLASSFFVKMAHVVSSDGSSVAEQLPVRLGQEYRVKLGRSFTFPEQNSFHTIKYDFKPQSVDSSKPGHLKVTDDEVNVSLPVVGQGESVDDSTHFRGNKKPCMKECILIINTRTGEAILEKISNNVNLKAIRDGRKPQVNRDRSVSPSPFMMQSKGHQSAKAQLGTSGHRHLTPSPIPTSSAPASNSSTPSAGKVGGANSSTKKGQKRQTAKTKTPKTASTSTASAGAPAKQESSAKKNSTTHKPKAKKKNGSSDKQSMAHASKIKTEPAAPSVTGSSSMSQLPPPAMASMPVLGMDVTREISPLQSANPTPEPPILPPSRKKPKLASGGNSSPSSSSDSSDSDSEGEEPLAQVLNAPPNQSQAPPHFVSSRVLTAISHSQSSSMPVFTSTPPTTAHKGHIAQKSQSSQLIQQSGAAMSQQPPRLAPPKQTLSSASSSDSDSDSSSGSSTSDSSSDSSDEENDKEVAALSGAHPSQAQRTFTRSYSELKTDLQLSSDSGSSSD